MAAGFVLLSVTTSLPELSVLILSSVSNEGGLSVGNVLGSNIANLTIIITSAIFFSKSEIFIKGESQKRTRTISFHNQTTRAFQNVIQTT